MRADRRRWLVVVGVAGAVLLSACGGGGGEGDEAGVDRVARATTSTTAAPLVTTSTTTTTPTPASTPPTPAPPATVTGGPRLTITPTRAAAGTRVRIEGDGYLADPWHTAGGDVWLIEAPGQDGGCGLVARAENDLQVSAGGHLSGGFVVPAKGMCPTGGSELNTGPLRYDVAFQCTGCHLVTFTVILEGESMEEPTGQPCPTVAFGVQNVASDIYADGLSCEEAESFLRAHAGPWGPMSGPAHAEADGFTCDRTGRSEVYLPRANYKCTRAAQAIFFVRT